MITADHWEEHFCSSNFYVWKIHLLNIVQIHVLTDIKDCFAHMSKLKVLLTGPSVQRTDIWGQNLQFPKQEQKQAEQFWKSDLPSYFWTSCIASLGKTFERGFNRIASLRSSGRPIESKHAMCWVTGIHLTRSLGNSNDNWSLRNGGICNKPACLSASWKASDKERVWGKPALGAWVLKLLLSWKQ